MRWCTRGCLLCPCGTLAFRFEAQGRRWRAGLRRLTRGGPENVSGWPEWIGSLRFLIQGPTFHRPRGGSARVLQALPWQIACSCSRALSTWSLSSGRRQVCRRPRSSGCRPLVLWGYGKPGFLGESIYICLSTIQGWQDFGCRAPHRTEQGGGSRWERIGYWQGRHRLVGHFRPQTLLDLIWRAWRFIWDKWSPILLVGVALESDVACRRGREWPVGVYW